MEVGRQLEDCYGSIRNPEKIDGGHLFEYTMMVDRLTISLGLIREEKVVLVEQGGGSIGDGESDHE